MANVIRLQNGGTIQVRTGVLAGVGPEGPRGLMGLTGPEGPQGPTGEVGPIGQILQIGARANISAPISMVPDTDTLLSFGTVAYDDMSVFSSSTNFVLAEVGDYLFSIWVRFDLGSNVGDSSRRLRLNSVVNGDLAFCAVAGVTDESTYLTLTYPVRTTTPNETIRIYGRSGDDSTLNIAAGSVTINRIGSGPQGPPGPQGPAGPNGAQGIPGPQGPAGNADDGFGTYADLR